MPAQTATELVWYLLLDTYGEAVAESSLDALEVAASETVLEFRRRVYEANAAILGGFVAAQLSVFRGADEFGLGTSAALTAKVAELKSCDARPLLVTVKAATEKPLQDALSLYFSGIQDVAKIGYPRFSAFLYDAACLGLVTRVYEPSTKELMITLEDNASAILSQWESGIQLQALDRNESEWRKVGRTKTEAAIKEGKSKGNPSSAAASIKSAKGPTAKNAEKNTTTNYRPFSSNAPTVFQHVELAMRIAGGMPTRASVLETIVDPKVWRSYGSFKLYLQAAESAKVVDLNFDKPKDILVSLPAEVLTPIVLSENVNESMPVSDSGTRLPLFTKSTVSAEDEKTSVETIRSMDPVDVAPEFVPSKVASSSVTIAPACENSEDAASVTLPNSVLNDEDIEFDEWGLPLPAFDQGVNSNETLTAKYPQEYETVPAFIQQNILPPTLPYSASYTSISYTQPIYRPMVATAPQFSQHEPQAQWVFPVSKSITIRSPYDQNVIPLPQREVNDDKPPIWRAPASKAVQIQNPKTRAIVTVSATGSVVESTNHSLNPDAGVFVLEDDFVELEDERILPSEVKVSNKTFNAALIGSDKLRVEQSINELRNNEERKVDEMSTPISEEMASISMDTFTVDQECEVASQLFTLA
ncbi:hypothetical protein HDU79_004464 [Rhizoclosmatium sp. JEL0117]|nr:hypothetical protein HDU79_004464 [Rhizoclosmatium sp. JEL0117]